MEHIDIPAGEIHAPFNWEFADATAQAAAAISDASLIGRVALVLSTMTAYRLTSVAPAVWTKISNDAGIEMATQAELQAVADAAAADATSKASAAQAASTPAAHAGAGGSAHSAATVGSGGFMSAADKTKLDGIEAGANA